MAIKVLIMGLPHEQVAGLFGVNEDSVSRWVRRFNERGIDGLTEGPRSGRLPKIGKERTEGYRELILHPERVNETHFLGADDSQGDRELYGRIQAQVAHMEQELSQSDLENPLTWNVIFMNLDWFVDNAAKWINDMEVSFPVWGWTGKQALNWVVPRVT
jgi:hypothetical protein